MNNILVVGNGFDIAHGLLTKYDNFLYLMKNWIKFYAAFEKARKNKERILEYKYYSTELWDEQIDKYLCNASAMDKNLIDKLHVIICDNSWVKYFCNCEAEIDGWIDFEKEIYPVIELFKFVFDAHFSTAGHGVGHYEAYIDKRLFSPQNVRIAKLWDRYFDISRDNVVTVKAPYVSMQYGILKKKIMDDLRKEFDNFIMAFEIYLHEFVHKLDDIKVLKQIRGVGADFVISFNYTLTEKLYGIKEENVHHIHGRIREELNDGINNMVLGVNECERCNMDFIYFVKYFQRIQKASGIKYKRFVNKTEVSKTGRMIKEKYKLYIYGHSLDETDEDILKYLIGDKGLEETINLKPEKIIIFYYDSTDYEQKVINLIKLYGRTCVEECMERGGILFVPTNGQFE